jgi:hypothetical protein
VVDPVDAAQAVVAMLQVLATVPQAESGAPGFVQTVFRLLEHVATHLRQSLLAVHSVAGYQRQ